MTREHLWPASLHRRLATANSQTENTFWLARLKRAIPNEPQIRDVCAKCNNGVLSELDEYICGLFDSTLVRIRNRHERVVFEYHYHPLKRWLLKLSFNSARIHGARDLFAIEAVLPYILGKSDSLGRSVQLFVQLSYAEEIPESDLGPAVALERPVVFEPTLNRAGHVVFRVHGTGEKVLRAIHLRSFTFYLAFFKPGEGRAAQMDFANVFTRHMNETVLLRPSQNRVELLCNGMGAWTSFAGSQTNKLIFHDDPARDVRQPFEGR